ncbi:MAG: response regulator [Candidatus Ratteibacteria bacterium]|jgi:DNA-binding NtrC family response regulator
MKNKILVIDDEIGPRESLRILFKDNYDVLVANNGEEGIQTIKKNPPDLTILDLKMPGMDGIEVLQKIKAIDPKAKVIILTGYGSPEVAQQAQRLGVTLYLNKPFDIFEIRQLVAEKING